MPLELSEVGSSSTIDADDVVVTVPVTKPAERYWKRNQRCSSDDGIHPIVVVPSDSEDDSDDDVAIVSVCPAPPSDNDDCIVESYQPAAETFCPDRMLPVPPASDDDPAVDVSCANSDLDLQFATYNQSTDQSETFLDLDVPNLGAWLLSSESASSVKQPVMNSVQNTCSGDAPVLACSSTFGVPLSIPSANKSHPQSTFNSESVQFNTVKLQTGGILFDMGAAKVSANIDKASVLSLSAKIQSSDDRHSTTVSFVGSISDGKIPPNSDFVSVQTGISHPPDDLNLSLVTVSPAASPDVVSSDRVNSYCQTASVSLNVNTNVDAALNDTVDGLLRQISCQKKKHKKPHAASSATDVKDDLQTKEVHTVDNKAVVHRCIPIVSSQSFDMSHSCSHVPTSSGSFAFLKKRKSDSWTSASATKTPRLPLLQADAAVNANNGISAVSGRPSQVLQDCCCCEAVVSEEKLSHCFVGHPCCGTCLQKHVKSVLTSNVKVDIACRKPDCDSLYLASELRNSLPEMVVEILQEKLDQKLSEDVSCLPLADGQLSIESTSNVSASHPSDNMTGVRCEDGLYEFPKNWEPMDDSERYRKVEVEPGSDEYVWVSSTFHQTMSWPRAHILRIHRVQNQTLWQFYVVKRRQMQRDSVSSDPVNEKFLFHGTSRNAVDAICANNFDWRLCGSHGTVYGQGSYFATEASYSHMYTDAASSSRSHVHQPSLFGLGMRGMPVSYRRHIAGPSLAAAFVNVPSLYPVGSAPPAHQPKTVVSPQVNVQPAHQPIAGLPSTHVGPSTLPVPDVSTFVPPIFRIPSVTYSGSPPSLGATGAVWGQNGSCSRCPLVTGNTSQVVDPNMQSNAIGCVLSNRPLSFSAACPHKSLFLPPPMAHRLLPSLPSGVSRSSMVPGSSGNQPSLTPQYSSSSHSHHNMFFARVLVGQSAVGRSDYRTPPPLNPSDQFGRCFDSCVNRPIDPSIYVIFNSAQSYPEYIIEYVNKSKSADPM